MCAISGSFDKTRLEELYKLNTYRGELSYSLTSFRPNKNNSVDVMLQFGSDGKIPDNLIKRLPFNEGYYYLTHSQAPTTDTKNIHPAVCDGVMLWHNGIIKQKTLAVGTWDTEWLLEQIIDYGWPALSKIDGTFACVLFASSNLYVFRNEISPLFVDADLNISSTKAKGFKSITPNIVYKMNLNTKTLEEVAQFETFENPYFIPEE